MSFVDDAHYCWQQCCDQGPHSCICGNGCAPEGHGCTFVEEAEPSGRRILGPCLTCGTTAMDALATMEAKVAHARFDSDAVERLMDALRDVESVAEAGVSPRISTSAIREALAGEAKVCWQCEEIGECQARTPCDATDGRDR